MSNSTELLFYQSLSRYVVIYAGLFILITGVVGGGLNILVFTTLKTFRHTPCVFYLTTTSIVNVAQLLISLLIRILALGFSIDLTQVSWFCKLRSFFVQSSALVSLACMTLATADQFVSMTHRRLSSLQLAYRHVLISCILILIHGITVLIYFDSPSSICGINNAGFAKYFSYFYFPVILGFLPIGMMIIFSLLAFFKTRSAASRNVHIEHLGRNRQLTAMVLVQVVFIVIFTVPYLISNIYVSAAATVSTDPVFLVRNNFLQLMTILLYYESYSTPCYVFCCVSKRFRKQVVHVLIEVHLKRFQQAANNFNNNQVAPEIEIS
ncbi:hypothetical protein I4U23_030552 [Adineta vaga]|nr:hypothetical protein I4U23_030552 [Adineta vaga]